MASDPTAEEIAEARGKLTQYSGHLSKHFLLGWLITDIRAYETGGYDPDRNRAALAMITAYEQLRAEQLRGEGREHLDWCVERAMEYANRGDMVNAWASFVSDCMTHSATAHIPAQPLFGVEMLRLCSTGASAEEFRRFVSGWAVSS